MPICWSEPIISTKISRWLLIAGFALTIFGGKLWLISAAGFDLPIADAWDAEADRLLRPFAEHHLTVADFFLPYQEQRLVTTKLYAFALFLANDRQWSVFLELVVNAAVHTASAVVLLLLARRWIRDEWLAAFGALLVVLFTFPFAWENTLNGFHVQFYLLLLFSLLHLALTFPIERFTIRWVFGQIAGALATLTMTSGIFSSVVVALFAFAGLARTRRDSIAPLATLFISVVLIIAGMLLRNPFPGHDTLSAPDLAAFAHAAARLFAWPDSPRFPWVVVPAIFFLWAEAHRWKRRRAPDPLLPALFTWGVIQCCALAYHRGGAETVLAPRYLDLLVVQLAAIFIFLASVAIDRLRTFLAIAWLFGVILLVYHDADTQWRDAIAPNLTLRTQQLANVRAYVRTLEVSHIVDHRWPEIPYPNAAGLMERLNSAALRAVLPPGIRRPLHLAEDTRPAPTALPLTLPQPGEPIALSTFAAIVPPPFSWRSALQRPPPHFLLRLQVAGDLGIPGARLRLVLRTTTRETEIIPAVAPGLRWQTIALPRPAEPWRLEAFDGDADRWFAVTEPVEVGRAAWCAEKFIEHFTIVLGVGCMLLVAGGALMSRPRVRRASATHKV